MRAVRRSLFLIACGAAAWAIAAALTGGIGGRVAGVNLASRNPIRPLILAALAAGIYRWRFRREFVLDAEWGAHLGRRLLMPLVGTLSLSALVLGMAYGTFVASGADSYGYVSQADLWLQGQLRVPQPWVSDFQWPNAEWTFTPLGYRPATVQNTIVPAYSSGLPLLMAGAKIALGPTGPYAVVPFLGAVAVWLIYLLGRDWTGSRSVGALAALLLAVSPTFLYQLMWPMTDIPVMVFWTLGLFAAFHSRRPLPLIAGLAAGAAILIRPNLLPVGFALPAAWWWPCVRKSARWSHALAMTAWYVVGMLPGVVATAAIDFYLYGSPLLSGYGAVEQLFNAGNLIPNFRLYSGWLIETQTPLVVLGLLPFVGRSMLRTDDGDRLSRRTGLWLFMALVAISYLSYATFDAWWYLRFFLPIFPVMLALTSAACVWLLRQTWQPLRAPIALLIFLPFAGYEAKVAADHGLFRVKGFEHRYIDAAERVAQATPADAVIISMQHSGSVRYYSGRKTLRYDFLPPDWLDRAVAALNAKGVQCFVLVDDWEEPIFRGRFGSFSPMGGLDWKPIAEVPGPVRVRLFDINARHP